MKPVISILILTHNAPAFVEETLHTLKTTETDPDIAYEVIVVDNASEEPTKELLRRELALGNIDRLEFSPENLLFAGGNNYAATLVSPSSRLLLLLNSDVSIRDPKWLRELYDRKTQGGFGVASFGYSGNPDRADGFCYLIDRELYARHPLDEQYPWFWGLTQQQAQLLNDGVSILAITHHNRFIVHYGGKSGFVASPHGVFGREADLGVIYGWFGEHRATVFDYHPLRSKLNRVLLKNRPVAFLMNCIRYGIYILRNLGSRREKC